MHCRTSGRRGRGQRSGTGGHSPVTRSEEFFIVQVFLHHNISLSPLIDNG